VIIVLISLTKNFFFPNASHTCWLILFSVIFQPNHFHTSCHGNFKYTIHYVVIVHSSLHFTFVYAKYVWFLCMGISAHIIVFKWFVDLSNKFNGNPSSNLRFEAVVLMRLFGLIYFFLLSLNFANFCLVKVNK
jgi:hypothetical protein